MLNSLMIKTIDKANIYEISPGSFSLAVIFMSNFGCYFYELAVIFITMCYGEQLTHVV